MRRPWLAPLVPLYAAGLALRDFARRNGWEATQSLRYPVISIGNLSAGGAGKTPLTIALVHLLKARGYSVDVLSRGYGRRERKPARVDPEGTAEQFGDEPVLIARATGVPVYVAPQRHEAGLLAENSTGAKRNPEGTRDLPLTGNEGLKEHDFIRAKQSSAEGGALAPEGRGVHLLDDGFQHRQLHRDIDILLLSRDDWRDALIPAGNRRETLRTARRADVIAIPSHDPGLEDDLRGLGWTGPIWRLRRQMQVPAIDGPVLAFCGIARPGQFFAGLESAGLALATRVAMRDHHPYSATDVDRLLGAARSAGARAVVTTEKDAVRLGRLAGAFPPEMPLHTAPLNTVIEDQDQAIDWLEEKLKTSPLAGARQKAVNSDSPGRSQPAL